MQIETLLFHQGQWKVTKSFETDQTASLVTIFGDTDIFKDKKHYEYLKDRYPHANIIGCSSSGNIDGSEVSKSELVVNAVSFTNAKTILESISFDQNADITLLATELAQKFDPLGLKHIFLLSDGLNVNGSELVKGFNAATNVQKTGGMAGDGARFLETYVIANAPPKQKTVAALGFYGDSLRIGSGCFAGWSEFGTQRVITKSDANILYELDGEPALDLYRRYLGEYADQLPNSGLRFPLSIKESDEDEEVIRTLLAIDEEKKSITFAGDVPTGAKARLMKPDIDILIDGAAEAAHLANQNNYKEALGIVVSCIGRKIVMSQLIDEELEAVARELGENVTITGFYSYGEIAPFKGDLQKCQLHNQTMTLTVIYED